MAALQYTKIGMISTVKLQDIEFRVLGSGKPVILLHGSMIANPWQGFEKKLAKYYKVYLPIMPGFGNSNIVKGKIHNTNLFSNSLCQFIKRKNLSNIPIISLSFGGIISLKSAIRQCNKAKLILIGLPFKVSGWKSELAQITPLFLRRFLIKSNWIRTKLLIPSLKENTQGKKYVLDKNFIKSFLNALQTTNPKSLIDTNYKREVVNELPFLIKQVKNKTYYIYGENDIQKENAKLLNIPYITIPNATHNTFTSNPEQTLKEIKKIIEN